MRLLRAGPDGGGEPPLVLVPGGVPDGADASRSGLLGELARDRAVLAPGLPGGGGTTGVPVQGPPSATADLLVEAAAVERCGHGVQVEHPRCSSPRCGSSSPGRAAARTTSGDARRGRSVQG